MEQITPAPVAVAARSSGIVGMPAEHSGRDRTINGRQSRMAQANGSDGPSAVRALGLVEPRREHARTAAYAATAAHPTGDDDGR